MMTERIHLAIAMPCFGGQVTTSQFGAAPTVSVA
jgi:hypothetical protein